MVELPLLTNSFPSLVTFVVILPFSSTYSLSAPLNPILEPSSDSKLICPDVGFTLAITSLEPDLNLTSL